MFDPAVQAALVVLVAFGLKFLFGLIGLAFDDAVLNTIAGVIVAWLASQFGLRLIYRAFPGLVKRGLLGP